MKIPAIDDEPVNRKKMKKIMCSLGKCKVIENGAEVRYNCINFLIFRYNRTNSILTI